MIKNLKIKKILLTVLFILLLLSGVAAAGMNFTNSAFAEEGAKIEVVGASVRYPKANESVPEGTGLRFEVKLSGVEIENVQNLGVLVDSDGVPTIELTGDKHVRYIENGVISTENVYDEESAGVYTMRVSLVNVPINHFHHEFVCRAYYQVSDGEVVYSDTVKRSATYVIKNAIEDTSEGALTSEQKKTLENLRNASKDHTYAAYGDVIETPTESKQGTRKAFCACGKEIAAPIGLYHYVFDTNGGETVEPQDGYSYDTIILPTPVRSGAEFLGWYNEADEKAEQVVVPYEQDVTGETVTLKAKWRVNLTENNLMNGFTFDSETKIAETTTCESGIATSYDSENNAMKITASVNNKKAKINVSSFTLNVGNKIVVRALSAINVGFCINGVYKMTVQETNGTNFKEYVWTVTEETVVNEIAFMPYVKSGALYVQSILVVKEAKTITVEQLENGYAFDNSASILAYTTCEKGIMAGYDSVTNSMLIKPTEKNKTVMVNIDSFTLDKGDKIVVKAYCQLGANTASFIPTIDGKKNYITIKTNTGFQEYVYTATATCTVTAVQFTPYTASGELYIQSIQVVRANAN